MKLGFHLQKNEIRFMSFTLRKNQLEVIKDLNLKRAMLKVLEENIGTTPPGTGVSKGCLNRTGIAQEPALISTHRTT